MNNDNRITLNDLSSLYFRKSNTKDSNKILSKLPLIGPIEISRSNVTEGRGLVASRDVEAGECLFVTKPSSEAPVEEVRRVWLNKCKCGDDEFELTKKLEQIAETILLKKTKRVLSKEISGGDNNEARNHRMAALSIVAQIGDHHTAESRDCYSLDDIDIIANNVNISSTSSSDCNDDVTNTKINIQKVASKNDTILSIIRQNSFGPDFRHYQSIAKQWLTNQGENPYRRILSLYPLAAMINHSCKPNAVRVYTSSMDNDESSEVMVAHATQAIKQGEEIVWSYVPTTRPYHDRRKRIKETFGFDCICERCKAESSVFVNNDYDWLNYEKMVSGYEYWNEKAADLNQLPQYDQFRKMILRFEELLSDKRLPGETSRYLRSGMTTFYTNYFNASLSNQIDQDAKLEILNLASKIHLSLASVDHGNTEHLSILHLCYELAAQQRSKQNLSTFWSRQLQIAHELRYGQLGNDVERLRKVLIHSRGVLRQRQGFEEAQYCFI